MKKIIYIILICIVSAFFVFFTNTGFGLFELVGNWRKGDPSISVQNEIVMPPNSTIEATTRTGKILVTAGAGLKRSYTWDGVTRSVVMWPRNKRWYGSLGLYYPGPGSHWLPKHGGISRGVLQEGQQHFNTLQEAKVWIENRKQMYPVVYSDDGLLVSYGKTLAREQLDVEVWQLLINGKKPERLEGSNNAAIIASWTKAKP